MLLAGRIRFLPLSFLFVSWPQKGSYATQISRRDNERTKQATPIKKYAPPELGAAAYPEFQYRVVKKSIQNSAELAYIIISGRAVLKKTEKKGIGTEQDIKQFSTPLHTPA